MSSLLRSLPPSSAAMAPRAVASSSYHSTRALHILPPFDNLQLKKSVNGQRGGQSSRSANVFLPPAVVQRLSREYHQGLLDRLNEQVRGTKLESLKILETITSTAGEPDQALAFNYASNALNNAFFLSGLRQGGNPSLNRDFTLCLIKSFGSLRDFEEASARTIDGMTSSGWLWLVKRHRPNSDPGEAVIEFRVSYAAGTIVSPSRVQSGPFSGQAFVPPLPEPVAPPVAGEKPAPVEKKRGRAWSPDRPPGSWLPERYSGPASTSPDLGGKGLVTPLACLSLHERAYLDHFGHGGRLEYFRQWLHALDYDKLMARVNASGPMIDYEAGEDAAIELWQASAESVTPAQVEAINDALERARQHDNELVKRGEEPIYKLAHKLDMQYKPDARTDHAYYNAWVSGTLAAEPEADEAAVAEEPAAAATEASEESAAPAVGAAESAPAPTASEEAAAASTPAEETETASTPAVEAELAPTLATTEATDASAEASLPESASAEVSTESAPAGQSAGEDAPTEGVAPAEGEASVTKPTEGASGSQSNP